MSGAVSLPENQPDRVVQRARDVVELGSEALRWIEAHPGLARKSEAASLRRLGRRARSLAVAATRPASVAVFGASQAGKSYLVENLATSAGCPLAVNYGEHELNFLRDMNPVGGAESTGLVSRFTLRAPVPPPGAPPVPVRLLARGDIVRIIGNTHMSDFKLREAVQPTPEQTAQRLAALPTGTGRSAAFTLDDVEELRDYFIDHFHDHASIRALGEAYWLQLADSIERLPLHACIQAFSPLWGGTAAFTDLAIRLLGVLEELGYPELAFCDVGAFGPGANILNVSALFDLGRGSDGTINLVGMNGRAGRFDRAIVAALIAELAVPIAEAAWPFLERTDLLDFPGARSREIITDLEGFLAKPEQLGHVFLRGKVAYLFQRYQAEQEVTAMLLCIGDSVQDVQTLPGMVDEWVHQAIGATPQERSQQRDSLFVVLTKFDREFEEKAGEDPSSGERWTARLNASLLNFFRGNWVREWKPGRAFDNVCWLRATSVGFAAVFDYDEADGLRRERAVGARAASMVAVRRKAYLANELVTRHVRDASRAWDEVMTPRDGGIAFLAGRLAPVCDQQLRLEQVAAKIERLAREISAQLRPHYRSGDIASEVKKAFQTAMLVARPLTECARRQMFGPLLRELQVSRDQMIDVWRVLQTRPDIEAAPVGVVTAADDIFGDLFGEAAADVAQASSPGATARDRHEQFAEMALEEWARSCRAFASAADTETSFRMPLDQAAVLVAGLTTLASHLRLRDSLTERLRRECSHQSRITMSGEKQAAIAAAEIGDFVLLLGYRDVSEEMRPPCLDDKARKVFAARTAAAEVPALGDQPSDYTTRFLKDWISAFVQRLQDNAGDPGADGFDLVANGSLGAILARLEPTAA